MSQSTAVVIDVQPTLDACNIDEVIDRIRTALRARSGKSWSVKRGRGTGYSWIHITAPPKRCTEFGYMSEEDRAELGHLLGFDRPIHMQGESIPASSDYRREYVDRAEGRTPSVYGKPYWD